MNPFDVLAALLSHDPETRSKAADFFWHPLTLLLIALLAVGVVAYAVSSAAQ